MSLPLITLYGIPTCDTCKKAIRLLEAAGRQVTFRDIRKDPLSEAEILEIVTEFGDRAINRQSTSYRGFSDFLKASDPEAQIAARPTVMKRPVIREGDSWTIGWDEETERRLTTG
ncbi:arsenate reductase family protein [Pseudogemmobacter bohemicus]|uniref:arsenate reductase family protein n=1 Tax=Pseudogemmobacter bohemicus TaxID=2250708 RepID=UPI0038CDB432